MKFIIGLTGQTGAGKSSLKKVAKNNGFFVIDCDAVAHETTKKGSEALKMLQQVFSSAIINNDGSLNRKELARLAFSSHENTELLNKTVLPFIVEKIEDIIKSCEEEYILLDAPTLYESGIDKICQKTVAVLADKDLRKSRIICRDKLTELEAENRLGAGKPDEFYKGKTDIVIYNNGHINEFEKKFENILKNLLEGF